jgi:DNA-binding MarR family transcriptional regulator
LLSNKNQTEQADESASGSPEAGSVLSTQHAKLAEDACERATKGIEEFKQRITALERDEEHLRAQLLSEVELSVAALRVLLHIYNTEKMGHRDIGVMSKRLKMERQALQTHLDRLRERSLADSEHESHRLGHIYWTLTPEGREYVVERKMA